MTDKDLIDVFNKKIQSIYKLHSLIPLRGENDSYILKEKPIIHWFTEVTRHSSCQFNGHFNYNTCLDDLLFSSDEIIYFTAHLFFYLPYINTPLKDAYASGDKIIYPVFPNLPGKRYNMYIGICFEKIYNFWDRIGDLIASYFPHKFKGNIYFAKVIKELRKDYEGNQDFDWLNSFVDKDYKIFNEERINIVHIISKDTAQTWQQLSHVTNYERTKKLHDKITSFPVYFKEMNYSCKLGFEKTLNLLGEINKREGYNCDK